MGYPILDQLSFVPRTSSDVVCSHRALLGHCSGECQWLVLGPVFQNR